MAEIISWDNHYKAHQHSMSNMETIEARVDRMIYGPGGIMEMKQTIADNEAEIIRLKHIIADLMWISATKSKENV